MPLTPEKITELTEFFAKQNVRVVITNSEDGNVQAVGSDPELITKFYQLRANLYNEGGEAKEFSVVLRTTPHIQDANKDGVAEKVTLTFDGDKLEDAMKHSWFGLNSSQLDDAKEMLITRGKRAHGPSESLLADLLTKAGGVGVAVHQEANDYVITVLGNEKLALSNLATTLERGHFDKEAALFSAISPNNPTFHLRAKDIDGSKTALEESYKDVPSLVPLPEKDYIERIKDYIFGTRKPDSLIANTNYADNISLRDPRQTTAKEEAMLGSIRSSLETLKGYNELPKVNPLDHPVDYITQHLGKKYSEGMKHTLNTLEEIVKNNVGGYESAKFGVKLSKTTFKPEEIERLDIGLKQLTEIFGNFRNKGVGSVVTNEVMQKDVAYNQLSDQTREFLSKLDVEKIRGAKSMLETVRGVVLGKEIDILGEVKQKLDSNPLDTPIEKHLKALTGLYSHEAQAVKDHIGDIPFKDENGPIAVQTKRLQELQDHKISVYIQLSDNIGRFGLTDPGVLSLIKDVYETKHDKQVIEELEGYMKRIHVARDRNAVDAVVKDMNAHYHITDPDKKLVSNSPENHSLEAVNGLLASGVQQKPVNDLTILPGNAGSSLHRA